MPDVPAGLSYQDLVHHFVEVHGGWTALADELVRRVRLAGGAAPELESAQKGLRRLARRVGDGGQYGRWMLRHFGAPPDVAARLRWVAQYHSRFGDLPASVRRDHLRLWDRPPTSESGLVVWVHVGFASLYHRAQHDALARERWEAARRAQAAEPAARVEVALLGARLASDAGSDLVTALLDEAETALADVPEGPDRWCYRARLVGQRAFAFTRASHDAGRFAEAAGWFEALPADTGVPFVDYRRTAGLAYHAWRMHDVARGRALARSAVAHAGDGGFVRFRAMALNLLARMSEPDEAASLRARAERLAAAIEDAHLQAVNARHR